MSFTRSCVWIAGLAVAGTVLMGGQSLACTTTTPLAQTLGTYSPAAVKANAAPSMKSLAGLNCNASVLVVLGNNTIKAKFKTTNGLLLKSSGGGSIPYTLAADSGATVPIADGATIDYAQNNLLNLLGLLGGSSGDLPFYVKTTGGASLPAAGTYTDKVTIDWNWNLCSLALVLGACIGTADVGTAQTVVTVTLNVQANNVVVTMTGATTWDPLDGSTAPKAIPASRKRMSVTVSNPDIVPLDANTIALTLPIPSNTILALDGDGTSSSAFVVFTDGSPASNLTLSYSSGSSTTDNVDFSSDNGSSWTYAPVSGNTTSEGAVTHIRLRPQGPMAKQSSFTVSIPLLVR